jgi:amidase
MAIVGGQTFNPYGRKIFDTGGSSSGSGVAVAANYAAAVGTSGSILLLGRIQLLV